MTFSASSDESADLVRIIGRTILIVNVFVGLFILIMAGIESGPGGLIWHATPIGAAVGFLVSGPFAWAALRGIAQIRDRVEVLVEEEA